MELRWTDGNIYKAKFISSVTSHIYQVSLGGTLEALTIGFPRYKNGADRDPERCVRDALRSAVLSVQGSWAEALLVRLVNLLLDFPAGPGKHSLTMPCPSPPLDRALGCPGQCPGFCL